MSNEPERCQVNPELDKPENESDDISIQDIENEFLSGFLRGIDETKGRIILNAKTGFRFEYGNEDNGNT